MSEEGTWERGKQRLQFKYGRMGQSRPRQKGTCPEATSLEDLECARSPTGLDTKHEVKP